MTMIEDAHEIGVREGYRKGDLERQALATANSNLRSDLLRVRTLLADLQHLVRTGDKFEALLRLREELNRG